MSGPMDPAELTSLREGIADNTHHHGIPVPVELAARLLADRDHHSARADAAEAELAKWVSGDKAMSAGRQAQLESEAAGRLLDEGEPVGLRAIVLDRAAKWIAIGGGATYRRDRRLATYSTLGHELIGLARFEAPAPTPHPQGLRARTVKAETLRDCYRAKLIGMMGADAFEAWAAESGLDEE